MATIRVFKQSIRMPFIVLAALEGISFCLSFLFAVYVRFDDVGAGLEGLALQQYLFGLIMSLSMLSVGLYHARLREGLSGVMLRAIVGVVLSSIALALLFYIFPELFVGRGVLAIAALLSLLAVMVIRLISMRVVDQRLLKRRILVLGAGDRADNIVNRLRRRSDQRGFSIVGFVHIKGEHNVVPEELIVDTGDNFVEYVLSNEIDEIVVAVGDRRKKFPLDELLDCKLSGVEVVDIITFFEREIGKIELDLLHPSWLIFSTGFDRGLLREYLERGFDVFASSLLLVVTWPVMLAAIAAIRIEDGRGASFLYKQKRVGEFGDVFDVLKFRSMIENAEVKGSPQWATDNDSRITRVGRFIRKTRIDELPQILNVLRGDMSFVGPRPERPEFVELLNEKIPYYNERHRVKPGITGWAQLCYPYGASDNDSLQKLQYDLYYVKNHNLLLDLIILIQTVEVVLFGKGAR
ncbi:MAG: UDP-phosphate galactose phosphotransferase [Gammaproteobacteria bacterium]|nr:MAG: UDP-phosphate galactose phosphotransferase [Gammaproteobacteria bacterium]